MSVKDNMITGSFFRFDGPGLFRAVRDTTLILKLGQVRNRKMKVEVTEKDKKRPREKREKRGEGVRRTP